MENGAEDKPAAKPAQRQVREDGAFKEEQKQQHEKDGGTKSSKKKNKKKNAQVQSNAGGAATQSNNTNDVQNSIVPSLPMQVPSTFPNISVKELQMAMDVIQKQQKSAKTPEEAMQKSYQFWNTQPVPKMDETIVSNEPIEPDKDSIRDEPYSLPQDFQWDTLNLDDPHVLEELYVLLTENYVEDDDAMFRFDYPKDFLKWALQPPGWHNEWRCGVRVKKSGKLVGFISAIPATVRVYDKTQKMVEINFLCVHKKLRSKRVAPVLIREITRRVNLKGIFQAVYTAGVVLPKPVATCRYWHRSLNPKKLIDIKFSHLSRNMTMQRTLKFYKLPDIPKVPGFRQLTLADVPQAHKLLSEYLTKFNLSPIFTEEEFKHWFAPQDGIVSSFVVENPKTKAITDMVSYYTLPSSVMHHQVHKTLKAAYSFYNVSTKTPWLELMQDALISAKNLQFDVFNALDLMDNKTFLEPLKFGIGDGNLQYYLYNWRCPSMTPDKIGLVLQ
ncbi:glycylpeptide N-tetradecanoyltransferase [Copidosoma floridanum]|uniref:glycylpeptide N-tetradecanoyltransferase n=1 Tax=Copidosoma floridanum TaxID=29053 RepID=UPI000C6FCA24|nr:glycylpeptide N-tetradecanoyltransferase [Copidosoma floridanum]